jgi:cysteinyl-tRNA synthetase
MEAISGKTPFVKYWMHTGFLENKSEKMSKSLDNFITLHEALQQWPKEVLRFFFLSAHYRSPLDFTDHSLTQAEAGVARIGELITRLQQRGDKQMTPPAVDAEVVRQAADFKKNITEALDDDFNTPQAMGRLFDFIRTMNQHLDADRIDKDSMPHILATLDIADHVLGIVPRQSPHVPEDITDLIRQRHEAKVAKDFTQADALRDAIGERGYFVDDTPYGPLVKKK